MPTATSCAGGWIVVDPYCQEFSCGPVSGQRFSEATPQVPVASCLARLKTSAIFRQKV
jgi:hypothetical protein